MAVQFSTAVRNARADAWQFGAATGAQQSGITLSAWAQNTAYTAFASWVAANGYLYLCRTSGTSATSGGGPTGYGTNITDGTAAWVCVGEAAIGPQAIVNIYTGNPPANCAAAETGTLLAQWTLAVLYAGLSSGGTLMLSSLPLSTTAPNFTPSPSNAGHYRIYDKTGTVCHEQGIVTATGGGGDATIDQISVVAGETVTLTSFSSTEPGA